jgi:hypothetical protein
MGVNPIENAPGQHPQLSIPPAIKLSRETAMQQLFTRRSLAYLLGALIGLAAMPALAAHRDPAPVPDEAVQKLVSQRLKTSQPDTGEMLDKHLDELADTGRIEQPRTAAEEASALASRRTLAAGKRFEIAALRSRIEDEMGQTRQRVVSLGLADKAKAWDEFLDKVKTRFDRLDKVLAAADAGDAATRKNAFVHLQSEIKKIRGDAAARATWANELPGPAMSQDAPPPAGVQPSTACPVRIPRAAQ